MNRLGILSALMLVAATAMGELLYYDGFPVEGTGAYEVGKLGSVNPEHASIVGFPGSSNNKWSAGSTANNIYTNTLSYPQGIALTPQAGEYTCGRGSGSPRGAYRGCASPALSNSVLYYSFLTRFSGAFPTGKAPFTEDFVAFDPTKGVSGTTAPYSRNFGIDGFAVVMTNVGDHVELQLKANSTLATLNAAVVAGTTYFVVVKYENKSESESVVSASVVSSADEPATWTASIATSPFVPTRMQVGGFGANSTANYWEFDEIRIGTAFADVAGVKASSTPATYAGTTQIAAVAYDEGGATANATLTAAFSELGTSTKLTLYWGETNGGTSATAWEHSVDLGDLTATSVSHTLTGLALGKTIFYRFLATSGNVEQWGTPATAAFLTSVVQLQSSGTVDECSVEPGAFTLSVAAATTAAIPVNIALGGSAVAGTDYTWDGVNPVVIASGDTSAVCSIYPVRNFSEAADHQLSLTVLPGPYLLPDTPTAQLTIADAVLPASPINAFTGIASALASEAANWTLGHVPTAAETVLYDLRYGRVDMEWDAAAPRQVGAWTQSANETNHVVFATTLADPLYIAGDVDMQGGVWTHAGPSAAPTCALAVTVGGNFNLGANAALNVGCAIAKVDPLACARGYFRAGPGYLDGSGSAFGGESFGMANGLNGNTYGSILNPAVWASSVRGSGQLSMTGAYRYAGPGLVMLKVGGKLTVDGYIAANGYAYSNCGGGASGGALNVECGSLAGAGSITANGGTDVYYGSGSGGRIRVKLTSASADFSAFTGTLAANGGQGGAPGNTAAYDTPSTAAGTIFLQTAACGALEGEVYVRNLVTQRTMTNEVTRVVPSTQLPPRVRDSFDASYAKSAWHLEDNARLRLTDNVRIRELDVAVSGTATGALIYPEGFTLQCASAKVNGVKLSPGTYTAANLADVIVGEGSVVIASEGTLVLIR